MIAHGIFSSVSRWARFSGAVAVCFLCGAVGFCAVTPGTASLMNGTSRAVTVTTAASADGIIPAFVWILGPGETMSFDKNFTTGTFSNALCTISQVGTSSPTFSKVFTPGSLLTGTGGKTCLGVFYEDTPGDITTLTTSTALNSTVPFAPGSVVTAMRVTSGVQHPPIVAGGGSSGGTEYVVFLMFTCGAFFGWMIISPLEN